MMDTMADLLPALDDVGPVYPAFVNVSTAEIPSGF